MKRLFALAVAALLVFTFAACGGKQEENWANEWGELTPEDFGVYLDGELVQSPEALQTEGAYGFFEAGRNARETTLRGTVVGDSPEKVAALFQGVECAVLDDSQPGDGEDATFIYKDFAAYLGGEEIGRGNVGLTYSYYIVDGRPLGLASFRAYAEAGESLEGVEGYTLTYLFYRGKVEAIFLDYERMGGMIEEDLVAE